jgi:hypothetical protein
MRQWSSVGLAAALVIAMATGCGRYDSRLNDRLGSLRAGGGGAVDGRLFRSEMQIMDKNGGVTGLLIHLPKEFFTNDQPAFTSLATLPPAAQQLGIVEADHSITYQIFWKDAAGKEFPAYIHIATIPLSDSRDPKQLFANAWPGTTVASWTEFGKLWERFSSTKDIAYTSRLNETVTMPGRVEAFYTRAADKGQVVVVWHAPSSITPTFDFFGAAEAAMKTIKITHPSTGG